MGGSDGSAHLWRVSDGKALHTLEGDRFGFYATAFSPDCHLLAIANRVDGTIKLWRVSRSNPMAMGNLALGNSA